MTHGMTDTVNKTFPDLSRVRRVRVDEPGAANMQRVLTERMAVAANESREREGDTEHE
jgi:hypothetical protein